jgi:hypothetical protein
MDRDAAGTNLYGAAGDVYVDQGTVGSTFGLWGYALNRVLASETVTNSYGVWARSEGLLCGNIKDSHGVHATATSGSRYNYGVYARALGCGNETNYGIYAYAPNSAPNWAGYFTGWVYSPHGTWQPSDENLKRNINDYAAEEAESVLSALTLHSYEYETQQYEHMNLPEGPQVGLLAQELEAVLPRLVRESIQPAVMDSSGNEVVAPVSFKTVNYTGLIPYLIAGYQSSNARAAELEDQLTAQNERLDQLESMLLDCCNRGTPDGDRSMEKEQELLNGRSNERSMQVVPNPFRTETTIHYNLERGGRVQLMANSADGKQLRVLSEATSEAGVYQFNWNTADLAAGMYYVTLLLDGEPITKRAVKIDR